jgi:hypothetical protein
LIFKRPRAAKQAGRPTKGGETQPEEFNMDALDDLFDYAGNLILLFTALIIICGPALYEIAR